MDEKILEDYQTINLGDLNLSISEDLLKEMFRKKVEEKMHKIKWCKSFPDAIIQYVTFVTKDNWTRIGELCRIITWFNFLGYAFFFGKKFSFAIFLLLCAFFGSCFSILGFIKMRKQKLFWENEIVYRKAIIREVYKETYGKVIAEQIVDSMLDDFEKKMGDKVWENL